MTLLEHMPKGIDLCLGRGWVVNMKIDRKPIDAGIFTRSGLKVEFKM
jgi:hypothetical protein